MEMQNEQMNEQTTCVGLAFNKQSFASLALALEAVKPYLPFHTEFPCGNKMDISDISQISFVDVPCPCGNPLHWLVKWYPN